MAIVDCARSERSEFGESTEVRHSPPYSIIMYSWYHLTTENHGEYEWENISRIQYYIVLQGMNFQKYSTHLPTHFFNATRYILQELLYFIIVPFSLVYYNIL